MLFVWTHDSVGLGEDGPTHQPIEHLAALRAMPGLRVIRPADANETAHAWRIAVDGDGPTALILSRQKLPGARGHRRPGPRRGPRRLRPARRRRARHRADRHRQRGGVCVGRGRPAGRRRRHRPRRVDAVLGAVRARTTTTRRRCCPPTCRRWRSRRRRRSAGTAGPTPASASTASARRRRATVLEKLGFTRDERGRQRRRRWPTWTRDEDDDDQAARAVRRAGPEPLARQPEARLHHRRRAPGVGRRRHPGRHVEPDHLPEGHQPAATPTTSSSARSSRCTRSRTPTGRS